VGRVVGSWRVGDTHYQSSLLNRVPILRTSRKMGSHPLPSPILTTLPATLPNLTTRRPFALRHIRYELILSGTYYKDGGPLLYLLEPNAFGLNSRLA
jgi:hypothetical protein